MALLDHPSNMVFMAGFVVYVTIRHVFQTRVKGEETVESRLDGGEKVLLTIVMIVVTAASVTSSFLFFWNDFQELERAEADRNRDQVRYGFFDLVIGLHQFNSNWAQWTSTYNFVTDNLANRQRQLTASNREVEALTEARRDTLAVFEKGIVSQIELLESERRHLEGRRKALALRHALLRDHLMLIKALGGP